MVLPTIGSESFPRTKRFDMKERLALVHNAKMRTKGVDVAALEAQIAEKAARKQAEIEYDRHHDKMASFIDKKLVVLEQERREVQAALNRDVADFRREHQARTRRREYDLSDPSSLRASLPARVGDDDPRTGVSSLQKFEGEDLAAGARRKAQSAQAAAWYDAQAAEKASARRRAAEEDRAHGALIDAQTAYQRRLAEAQKIAREDFERSVAEENARLAEARRAAAAAAAAESASTTAAELERAAADPTLAEDPALAVSALAPGRRVRVDHWKGMSREEIRGVTEMQATQRAEREATAAAVAGEDAANAARSEGIRRALEMRAEQVEAFKAEQRAAVHATIVAQREAKARRDADERADRFREGTFGPEYFAGFGASAR